MGRPRKLDALTTPLSARIRKDQDYWLRFVAEEKFEGELSQALRWALDQAQTFEYILREEDPIGALDELLNPPPDPQHPEDAVLEAEREFEAWRREQAIKRAQRKARESQ